MAKDKKDEAVKPAVKLKKEDYVLKLTHQVGDKTYKKGDKISLTKEGYRYLRSLKKV